MKRYDFSLPKRNKVTNNIATAASERVASASLQLTQKGIYNRAIFALGIVCFFWGTTWIASKQGVTYMPALQLAGIRQSIGGIIYVVFFLLKGTALPRGREWWPVIVLSFLNFMISNALATWGVQFISAGLGSIIGSIFPLWLVIIGLFGGQATMSRKSVLGLAVGFTGICVIFYQHLQDFFNADFRFGILLSVLATWAWAFATIYTKQQAVKFNPYFALGLQMVISGPVVYAVSLATHQAVPFIQIPWQAWAAIGYLVFFGSVISFIAYLYALQKLPTEQVSIYAYINPIVALFTGAILFGEKLTIAIVVGVCITLYGVRLVNKGTVLTVNTIEGSET